MERREKRREGKITPPVTVLMTVYNGMPYIKEAIKSICAQKGVSFTIVIINNGSTDGTKEYLTSLEKPYVHIEHLEKTISRTDVLNYGLEKVSTPYVAILDADDIAKPNRLVKQLTFLESNKDIALVGANISYIDETGKILSKEAFPKSHKELVDRLVVCNQFAHSACMFRTQRAKDVGGYPTKYSYAQDLALWLALIKQGGRVASLCEELTYIRVHSLQATKDQRTKDLRKKEDLMLTCEIETLPNLSLSAKQVAKLRKALLYKQLGNLHEAKKNLGMAVSLSPCLLVTNPLLWRRILLVVKKFYI